jgi:hypothetical protein
MTIRKLETKQMDRRKQVIIDMLDDLLEVDHVVIITAKKHDDDLIESGLHYHCSDELAEMMMEYGIKAIQQQNN